MFCPNLPVSKDRIVADADRFYRTVAVGLSSLLVLGGALHLLLFAQRINYVPLLDAQRRTPAGVDVTRLLDREGVAYLVREGTILVPSSARHDCLVRIEREAAAAAAETAPAPAPATEAASTPEPAEPVETSAADFRSMVGGSPTLLVHAGSSR